MQQASTVAAEPTGSASTPLRLDYQDQDSPMTLREGLAEYYAKNPSVTPPSEASELGATFFSRHDVTHVIFGTTTHLNDEIINDLWQMTSLDISGWEYVKQGLKPEEVREIVYDIGAWDMMKSLVLTPFYLVKVWRRARHMIKPWPWVEYGVHMDTPIGELRREFGIAVIDG